MSSNHLILCYPLLLLPSIFPSTRVFSDELALRMKWPKCWSFSISPSDEYLGLISFWINWFDLLVLQGTPKSFLLMAFLNIWVWWGDTSIQSIASTFCTKTMGVPAKKLSEKMEKVRDGYPDRKHKLLLFLRGLQLLWVQTPAHAWNSPRTFSTGILKENKCSLHP